MIKVCHLTSAHRPNDNRIFYKECVSLAKEGYDVYLVATGESYVQEGVNVVGVGKIPSSRLERMLITTRKVYKAALNLQCEVYHLHDPELLPYAILLKRKGKKVIFDSHEDYYQQIKNKEYIPKMFRNLIAKFFRLFQNKTCRYLDGFVFPSCSDSIDVPIKVTRVDNSPILDHYQENSCVKSKTNAICYIGSLTEDRGITFLIKAAFHAQVPLILAGFFQPEEYKNYVMNMSEFSIVDYRGFLDAMEIRTIIEESKIGMAVLLNVGQYGNSKNLATKVVEYCKFGLPVMLNKTPHNIAMIEKYNFGICVENPKDIEQYSLAIQQLISSPDRLRLYGENGKKLVETVLNWDNEFENLKNLYFEVLNCSCESIDSNKNS